MDSKSSRIDFISKNIFFAAACQVIIILVNFVVRRVFIHSLGEEYLGLTGLFTDILSMLSLAELGVGTSIIYSLYKPIAENDTVRIRALMQLYAKIYRFVGIFILIAGTALTPFLHVFVKEMPENIPHIECIYLLNVLNSGLSYFYIYKASLLFADQKKYVEILISTVVKFLAGAAECIVLFVSANYFLYLGIYVASTFIQNLIISIETDRIYPFLTDSKKEKLREDDVLTLKKNIGAMFFHKIGDFVVFGTDSILMAKFVGIAAVGLYSNYMLIRKALVNVATIIFNAITSGMGNLNACENDEKKLEAFNNIFFFSAWIFGFMSICLYQLYNPFITIWLGDAYLFSMNTVAIIVVNFYVFCMRLSLSSSKTSMGLFWNDRYKPLAESVLNLVISLILVYKYEIYGILLGTFLSTMMVPFWVEPLVVYKYGLHSKVSDYFIRYFYTAFLTLILCMIVGYINSFLPNNLYGFCAKCFVCTVIPNAGYFAIYHKRSEYIYLTMHMKRILKKVKNRFFGI